MTYAEGRAGGVGSEIGQRSWRAAGVETAELTHDEVRSQLSAYLAGELEEGPEARITGHLAQCSACTAYLATLRATIDLLQTLPARTPPPALRERLLAIPDREGA